MHFVLLIDKFIFWVCVHKYGLVHSHAHMHLQMHFILREVIGI